MRWPWVARSAFDERGAYIEKLETEAARLRSENHDLVNAATATNRVVQPFVKRESREPAKAPRRFNVYQREKRMTLMRRSDMDYGTAPGRPPGT